MKSWRPSPFTLLKIIPVLLLLAVGATVAQVASDVDITRNVEYGKGGGRALKLDILRPKVLPKEPMPVVIWIHGGGWASGSKESGLPLLAPFAKRGYFCATVQYRLSDESKWPAQIEDCKCAIRYLRAHAKEYNIDPNRIGVWGGSAGGHLVALLGTAGDARALEGKGGWQDQSSRVQAVCDWFGPTDFMKIYEEKTKNAVLLEQMKDADGRDLISRLFGGPFWERPGLCRQANPISYVSKDDPPFLIMHGDQDPLVPLSQSELLDAALRKAGVPSELIVIKGAGHGFKDQSAVTTVADFFDKQLSEPAKAVTALQASASACPKCGSAERIVPIVYGKPGTELIAKAERGDVILGGCMVSPGNPTRHCTSCRHEW